MQNLPNIEKLPGKPHYTGYGANGVLYHIHKAPTGWRASPISGGMIPRQFPPFIYGRTLVSISEELRRNG